MIRGKNIHKQLFIVGNRTVFDLSEGAATEMCLINPTRSIRINNVYFTWVEASSSGTGIALEIGSTDGGAEYFTATSSVSQDAGVTETYAVGDMVLNLIPAGTPVYFGHAGSKDGAGTGYLTIAYTVN